MKTIIGKARDIFILFLTVAFIGWIYEVILGFIHYGVYLNRGYLWGPWLPIYGIGSVIIYGLFGSLVEKKLYVGKINVKILIIIICVALFATVIELTATYIMQFNGIPYNKLWDYHSYSLNFEGRIALEPSIKFGLIGAVVFYAVVPFYKKFIHMKNQRVCNIISCVLLSLFILDLLCRIPFGNNYKGPA